MMNIVAYIDHTLLKPEATPAQITQLCKEAAQYGFASVCVNPSYVPLARELLRGSSVKVCTVIGYPLGATSTAAKLAEMKFALTDGAEELDMVIHIGRLKSGEPGDLEYVQQEIFELALRAHAGGAILKVIIETGLLTDDEKRTACRLAKDARADFVKTTTGFSYTGTTVQGATPAVVMLMRAAVGPDMGIKATGGVSDYTSAVAMIKAGATRLGASRSIALVNGAPKEKENN